MNSIRCLLDKQTKMFSIIKCYMDNTIILWLSYRVHFVTFLIRFASNFTLDTHLRLQYAMRTFVVS